MAWVPFYSPGLAPGAPGSYAIAFNINAPANEQQGLAPRLGQPGNFLFPAFDYQELFLCNELCLAHEAFVNGVFKVNDEFDGVLARRMLLNGVGPLCDLMCGLPVTASAAHGQDLFKATVLAIHFAHIATRGTHGMAEAPEGMTRWFGRHSLRPDGGLRQGVGAWSMLHGGDAAGAAAAPPAARRPDDLAKRKPDGTPNPYPALVSNSRPKWGAERSPNLDELSIPVGARQGCRLGAVFMSDLLQALQAHWRASTPALRLAIYSALRQLEGLAALQGVAQASIDAVLPTVQAIQHACARGWQRVLPKWDAMAARAAAAAHHAGLVGANGVPIRLTPAKLDELYAAAEAAGQAAAEAAPAQVAEMAAGQAAAEAAAGAAVADAVQAGAAEAAEAGAAAAAAVAAAGAALALGNVVLQAAAAAALADPSLQAAAGTFAMSLQLVDRGRTPQNAVPQAVAAVIAQVMAKAAVNAFNNLSLQAAIGVAASKPLQASANQTPQPAAAAAANPPPLPVAAAAASPPPLPTTNAFANPPPLPVAAAAGNLPLQPAAAAANPQPDPAAAAAAAANPPSQHGGGGGASPEDCSSFATMFNDSDDEDYLRSGQPQPLHELSSVPAPRAAAGEASLSQPHGPAASGDQAFSVSRARGNGRGFLTRIPGANSEPSSDAGLEGGGGGAGTGGSAYGTDVSLSLSGGAAPPVPGVGSKRPAAEGSGPPAKRPHSGMAEGGQPGCRGGDSALV